MANSGELDRCFEVALELARSAGKVRALDVRTVRVSGCGSLLSPSTLVSDPDPPCSTGCIFLITSTHRRVWYTPRSELVLDSTIFVYL